jgi:hypothetical protein
VARIINTEKESFVIGWFEKACMGVNDNKIIREPINPPDNNLHKRIFLFKKIAVKYRSRVSNKRFRAQITSKYTIK